MTEETTHKRLSERSALDREPPVVDGDGLSGLRRELQELRDRFHGIDGRITDYLTRREQQDPAFLPSPHSVPEPLAEQLELLLRQLAEQETLLKLLTANRMADQSSSDSASEPGLQEWLNQAFQEIKDRQGQIVKAISKALREGFEHQTWQWEQLSQQLNRAVERLLEPSTLPPPALPPEPEERFVPTLERPLEFLEDETGQVPHEGQWMDGVFGAELAQDPELSVPLDELRDRLLAGEAAVVSLVGHLMTFRGAPPERRPQLLKDLGEAYYRCCPKRTDHEDVFEAALVAVLLRRCAQAGFQNTIELVHPGERFDAARHSPVGKSGVEILEPHGWVVLRDNGKVYTKAGVSVR